MGLTATQQDELRALLTVAKSKSRKTTILISCSKKKLDEAAPASELYRSTTFRKSLDLARRLGVAHYILSARYGLVSPQCVLPPYDVSIHDLASDERQEWANAAARVLTSIVQAPTDLWFFASRHYSDPIIPLIRGTVGSIRCPLAGLPIGKMNSWLTSGQRIFLREELVHELYRHLEILDQLQGRATLREVVARRALPQQGIYFFFDPHEATGFSKLLPRLVRIGTHAISEGSRAILRTRLRTHLGTQTGEGNHRGSVFRLHVGAAMISRDGLHDQYPQWGKGQNAPRHIRDQEAPLEKAVSEYIGSLQLLMIEVADQASPKSKRAFFERQSIALLTEGGISIEAPGAQWLGRFSDKQQIRASGLWNVQHVGEHCDDRFLRQLAPLVQRGAELAL